MACKSLKKKKNEILTCWCSAPQIGFSFFWPWPLVWLPFKWLLLLIIHFCDDTRQSPEQHSRPVWHYKIDCLLQWIFSFDKSKQCNLQKLQPFDRDYCQLQSDCPRLMSIILQLLFQHFQYTCLCCCCRTYCNNLDFLHTINVRNKKYFFIIGQVHAGDALKM